MANESKQCSTNETHRPHCLLPPGQEPRSYITENTMQLIVLLPLFMLCCWIYAEKSLGLAGRLVTGAACMLMVGGAVHAVGGIGPKYESTAHRSSLRLADKLISQGQIQRVQQAIEAYNRTASTGTTHGAAMEMWNVLNHGPRQ